MIWTSLAHLATNVAGLLAEGAKFSESPRPAPSTTRSAAGSPSTSDGAADAAPPSEVKTSIAVWMGPYPTVACCRLALSSAEDAAVARACSSGTCVSSFNHDVP